MSNFLWFIGLEKWIGRTQWEIVDNGRACFQESVWENLRQSALSFAAKIAPGLCFGVFRTLHHRNSSSSSRSSSLVGQHPVDYKRSRRLLIPSIFRLFTSFWKSQKLIKFYRVLNSNNSQYGNNPILSLKIGFCQKMPTQIFLKQKKSHLTLWAKRATFTFLEDKS